MLKNQGANEYTMHFSYETDGNEEYYCATLLDESTGKITLGWSAYEPKKLVKLICKSLAKQFLPISEDMKKLIQWRDSLALDDWGDGLSLTIQYKLNREKEHEGRIPEELIPAFREFKGMNEDDQYEAVFSVLGE
jgi:hypothetical protein